jgi:heat shock protein HslJ
MLQVELLLLPLLLAVPALQATPTPASADTIPPLIWELTELTAANGQPASIAEPARYTVQFLPDGKIAVGADCNSVAGTYVIDHGSLRITLTATTLALCPPDSQAEPFLGLLEQATSFDYDADGNLLIHAGQGALRFRPSLLGVTWEWQDFRSSDNSIVAPKNPSRYTITFLPEGKLAIRADCNRALGTYVIDGARIDIQVGGVTRVMCPPGSLMNDYLHDLDAVSSHVFRDGNLYLALPIDAGIMAFAARYEPPSQATPAAG